jgi:hypothetical protein
MLSVLEQIFLMVYLVTNLLVIEKLNNIEIRYKDEISGTHGSEYEDDCLLGCCTM